MSRSARLIRSARTGPLSRNLAISPWIAIDAVLWSTMLVVAVWIRYDFDLAQLGQSLRAPAFYVLMASFVVLTAISGWLGGLYRGRYIPGSLLETSLLATLFAAVTALVSAAHVLTNNSDQVPRSTPLIAGAITIIAAISLRSLVRRRELFGAGFSSATESVLVFGAGEGGNQLVRQLRRSEVSPFKPVAILDDDSTKLHMVIDGVRVYGGRNKLEELATRTGANTLIIAVPSIPSDELIDIRDRAEAIGLHVLILPPLGSIIRGRAAADELRQINVDDLLGRKPARLNQTQIADYIRGKRVLVTGAGGSIGSELCRQLNRFRPTELMMLDRDESGLHSVQLSIQDQAMLDGDDTILASIRDRDTIRRIFHERKPEIVFHAAALKHMPLLEQYPEEAYKTNVIGTLNLLDAALEFGVETFVNISTDKAANPSTALGTSKRIAERLTAGRAARAPMAKYVSVRFGNVLGSRGSVLTVFEKQIADGGPVTVTDPKVKRFFMTIPEACQLVLQAAAVGKSGQTLVLDMGDPVKIVDVARVLIEQSGKDVDIVFTGLRESEKLSEELFDDVEDIEPIAVHEAITGVRVAPIDLEYSEYSETPESIDVKDWMARMSGDKF